MENNDNFSSPIKGLGAAIIIIVVAAFVLLPFSSYLLNVLIKINLLLSLIVLLVSLFVVNGRPLPIYPAMLFISVLLSLALNVGITRIILLHGPASVDVHYVWLISNFVIGTQIESLVIGLMFFIACFVIQVVVVVRWACRINDVSGIYKTNISEIGEKEMESRKFEIRKNINFLDVLGRVGKFLSLNENFKIAFVVVNFAGGITIGLFVRNEPLSEAFVNYAALAVGSAAVLLLPAFLLAISLSFILNRFHKKEKIIETI